MDEVVVLPHGTVQLLQVLRRHPDNSVTYAARMGTERYKGDRTHVARIFDGDMPRRAELLKRTPASRGVVLYDAISDGSHRDLLGHGRRRDVWATVRPFVQHTLADLMEGPLKIRRPFRAIQAVTNLAMGMQSLHDVGILHGDLRPSNIVVHDNTDMQIVDYGLLSPWSQGKVRPDHLAGFVAPEDFLGTNEPTREADVYVFGKIVRACLKVTDAPTRAEEQLLRLVIAECLRIEPDERPTIQRLVSLLRDQQRETEGDWHFGRHRQAVIADIDARVPDLLEKHLPTVSRSAANAIAATTRDVADYNVYRIALLQEAEVIHFLSTLGLTFLPKKLKVANSSSNNVMLKPVKYSRYELVEGQESRSPVELLDSEWRRELERITLGDLSASRASEEQNELLSQQLGYAAELRADILQSDGFVRSEDVAAIMSPSCPGITPEEVRILRDMGYLIGLPDRGITLYPIFQFDSSTGLPYSCIKTVSDITRDAGSIWRRNVWWFLETPRLNDSSPAQWLRERRDPDVLIASYSERFAA